MKRTSLILILLLLTLFNNAELKIEDFQSFLRTEASKAVQNLFGFSYSFTSILFEREVTIHQGNPTITAKLSSSCSIILMGSNSGYFKVEQGIVVSKNGTDITCPNLSLAGKYLDADFKNMTLTLSKKLQGAVQNGTIIFNFLPNEVQISIIISKTFEDISYEGSITFTIKKEDYPTPPSDSLCLQFNEQKEKTQTLTLTQNLAQTQTIPKKVVCQPSYDHEKIDKAMEVTAQCGAIAVGTVALFKLAKGVAGFFMGGPVMALIGLAT